MRIYVKDWIVDWVKENGNTTELEVELHIDGTDECETAYSGSFSEIPFSLYDWKVIECSRIVTSSIPERIGIFVLTISKEFIHER